MDAIRTGNTKPQDTPDEKIELAKFLGVILGIDVEAMYSAAAVKLPEPKSWGSTTDSTDKTDTNKKPKRKSKKTKKTVETTD